MASHDDQFQTESTPVAEIAPGPAADVTVIHTSTPQDNDIPVLDSPLDTEWDSDKTEVLTESLDSNALSAWLTDPLGFDIEMTRFPFVVGRSEDCDLTPNGRGLSRRHAEVIFHSGRFVIRDLDSVNGIQVNGCKVARVILDDGDVISIGDIKFTFKHRNPTDHVQAHDQALSQSHPFDKEGPNWLKLSSVAAALLVLVVGGVSAYQQLTQPDPFAAAVAVAQTKATTPPPTAPIQTSEASVTPTAPKPTPKAAFSKPDASITKKTVQQPAAKKAIAQLASTNTAPPSIKTPKTKKSAPVKKQAIKPKVKAPTVVAKVSRPAPVSLNQQQRKKSIRIATQLLQKADKEYLTGNAAQIISKLKIASRSKDLPASTKREVTKKHNDLNQLHTFYTAGNTALERNDQDLAFENWDKYLDRLDLDYPGEIPSYAEEVTRYMANEYTQKAQQASNARQYQVAYNFWQKAFSMNGSETASNQIALIEEKAHQLYRQGLRQEYVNTAKAKRLWQQVVKLVPPSSETFTKANAKLVWYARWEN